MARTRKTAINVEEAPAALPEPTPPPASMADVYLLPGIIGIIIAIAIGFANSVANAQKTLSTSEIRKTTFPHFFSGSQSQANKEDKETKLLG
jgi:hypothetical protein